MKIQLNKYYFTFSLLLFIIEALIATHLHTGFIRHTFGDYLVVMLLFCIVKSLIDVDSIKLAVYVLAFAYCIEFLQLFNILELLNLEQHYLLKLVLGTTFQFSDLVAYTLGIITVIFFELKIYKLWIT